MSDLSTITGKDALKSTGRETSCQPFLNSKEDDKDTTGWGKKRNSVQAFS